MSRQREADAAEDTELREVRKMAAQAVVLTERALARHERILAALDRAEALIREARGRRRK